MPSGLSRESRFDEPSYGSSVCGRPREGTANVTADAAVDGWREERMLIDGTLVAAAEGGTYDNVDPATEQVIGGAPLALTHGAHVDTPIKGVR